MNRSLPFRRWSCIVVGVLMSVAAHAEMRAQAVTLVTATGIQYRYHGDTIWRARDTTSIQTIYRRDTVFRSTFVYGRKAGSIVYLVVGDSSRILESRDAAGKFVTSSSSIGLSLSSLELDRNSIEAGIRDTERQDLVRATEENMRERNERAAALGLPLRAPPPSAPTVPLSPNTKQTYAVSANRMIEQLGDTVRYITGCSARPPVDTTLYLLFATDSVRRVSPSPRSFDLLMARAIRSDMYSVLLRQRVRAPDNPRMKGVPRISTWPCDKR